MSVRPTRFALIAAAVLMVIAQPLGAQNVQTAGDNSLTEYAFSAGLQAYLYGYPLVITEVSRREMIR